MAGIGEASAIITVAQIGIQVSKTIFEFVGEVKNAPKEIRRVGRDLCTTSERLEEIGRLIDKNHASQLFSDGGIASAVRCSNDCNEIITQVSRLLAKGGWVSGSAALDKKDLDISLFETLRWPFVRNRLASPQADLERVKASLSLLFNSAMANASSNPMQSEYALQIPKLKKWAEQATRKAANERYRSHQAAKSSGRSLQREVHWEDHQDGEDEEDVEMRQRFVEYRVKLIKEEDERRARERAVIIQAEKEAKKRAEEEARQKIEQKAIDDYKKEQDDIKDRKVQREGNFREELGRLGLDPEKIQSIIDTTAFQALESESAKQNLLRTRFLQGPRGEQTVAEEPSNVSAIAASKAVGGPAGPTRTWIPRRLSKSRPLGPSTVGVDPGHGHALEDDHGSHSTQSLQLWLVDLVSGQNMELAPSHEWLRSKLDNARHDEVSHKLAKLKHPWRIAILKFLQSRNEREPPHLTWRLCFIGLPRRVSKLALFGHRHGDCLVRLVVCQQKVEGDTSHSWPQGTDFGLRTLGDSMSIKSQTKASSKVTTGNLNQRLGVAPRHPSEMQGTTDVQKQEIEPREVSFANTRESEIQEDEVVTIRLETEVIGDALRRSTTTIGSNFDLSSALEELGIPYLELRDKADGDARHLLKAPQALTQDQIDQLARNTKARILEGEVPWRKAPSWKVEERETFYVQKTQPAGPGTEIKNNLAAVESARHSGRHDIRLESDPRNISRRDDQYWRPREEISVTEELNIPRDNRNRVIGLEHAKSSTDLHRNNPRPQNSFPSRYDWNYFPRRTNTWGEVLEPHGPRETFGQPRATPIQEKLISGRQHIDHGFKQKRFVNIEESDSDEIIIERAGSSKRPMEVHMRERERPGYREGVAVREFERRRPEFISRRRFSPIKLGLEENGNEEIIIRPRAWPKRRKDHESLIIPRGSPGGGPIDVQEEEARYIYRGGYDDEEVTARKRGRRFARDEDDSDIVFRSDRSRDSSRYKDEDGNKHRRYRPPIRRANRTRPRPSVVVNNHDLSWEEDRPFRPLKKPLIRSATRRSFSDIESYPHENRHIFDLDPTDEDIISSALERFTTFNANREDEITVSSSDLDFSVLPDRNSAPSYAMDLKSAQRKLDELLEKHEKATREGDFMTASDLVFYAIPDVKALVEELKAQEARKTGLPHENGAKVEEDTEQAPLAGIGNDLFDEFKDDNGLQPRVVELEDLEEDD